MANFIYAMCALTAFLCAWLLLQGYRRSRYRLLLWGGLCFSILTLNNLLLIADKILVSMADLSTARIAVALVAMVILLYGLIWDTE